MFVYSVYNAKVYWNILMSPWLQKVPEALVHCQDKHGRAS